MLPLPRELVRDIYKVVANEASMVAHTTSLLPKVKMCSWPCWYGNYYVFHKTSQGLSFDIIGITCARVMY